MKGKMKVRLVMEILIWVIISHPVWAADLTFEVGSATQDSYSKLLRDVRDKVKDPKLKYGGTDIPVMAAPLKSPKYLLIELKAAGGVSITIALNQNNLYVMGYLDKYEGNYRAHFFPDADPSSAKQTLFPEAKGDKNRVDMKYKSVYEKIEAAAKVSDRSKVSLGIKPLNKLMGLVYGKKLDVPNEAKLMLVVIQMFSEAARFKYIENKVLEKFEDVYNPDPKAMRLENRWEKISKGIKSSKNGVISPELDLLDDKGKEWKVTQVKVIAPDMALLKNVA